jgi:hypothetical protein
MSFHNKLLATAMVMTAAPAWCANSFRVTLRPCPVDPSGHVACVDVTETMVGPDVAKGKPFLRMPIVMDNVETVATTLTNLSASDAKGTLQLASHDDAEAGITYRHWTAERAIVGAVEVRYRVPVSQVLAPLGAAPPLELRSDHGAFSGQGETFLMLPEAEGKWQQGAHWDLSRMSHGAVGVTSLGVGDVATNDTATEGLGASFYMGGAVQLYPPTPPKVGFFAAWYGEAPFALEPVMASEQKLYAFYEQFFKRPSTAPYGVFLRENLVNAGGGVSLGNTSFVTTSGPKTELDMVKITLAHEMLHTFVGGMDGGEMDSLWYSEGLAVYYARTLALRASQITPEQFLKDLNGTAGRYYTDAMIHTPNDAIAAKFWEDTLIRVLPYDRGSMYFAVLNGELRSATSGKVTLDDLLLAMLDRKRHGLPADKAAWVDLLHEHLGAKGKAEFEAMLAGAIMLPQSGDFGPCFQRITKPMKRYVLGFDSKVLVERKRIVRGLIAGSAAEHAGVRNGDEITQPVSQDEIQERQDAVLTLKLLRDGKPLVVSYVPRGETVTAYQWVRVPGVTECAY